MLFFFVRGLLLFFKKVDNIESGLSRFTFWLLAHHLVASDIVNDLLAVQLLAVTLPDGRETSWAHSMQTVCTTKHLLRMLVRFSAVGLSLAAIHAGDLGPRSLCLVLLEQLSLRVDLVIASNLASSILHLRKVPQLA